MNEIVPWRKLLMSLVVSIVFLLGTEGILILLDIPETGIYQGDPKTVWWVRSNINKKVSHVEEKTSFSVITDDFGFRIANENDIHHNEQLNENGFILALGCSTTFGWGVEGDKMWTHILSQQIDLPVVNAGVPGWSTHQAKIGLSKWFDNDENPQSKIAKPRLILMSYGVRDQQLSYFADQTMKPTSMMFNWQIARLIRKGRVASRERITERRPSIARVSVQNYSSNLDEIMALWTDVQILYFVFPNLRNSISGHDQILVDRGGLSLVGKIEENGFFEEDPIHLNQKGNQHLAEVLVPHVNQLLGQSKHIE